MQEQVLDWEQTGCNATAVFGPEGTDCLLYSSPLLVGKLVEYNYQRSSTTRVLSMQHQPTALSISSGGILVAFADAAGSIGLMQYKTGQTVTLKGRITILTYHLLIFCVCADVNGTVVNRRAVHVIPEDLFWYAGHHIECQVLGFAQDDQSLVLCSGETMVVCSTSKRSDQLALTQGY